MLRNQEFQTPNAIDAGDNLPTTPSRLHDDDDDDENAEPNRNSRPSFASEEDSRSGKLERGGGGYKPNPSTFRGTKIPYGNNSNEINPQDEMFDEDPELPVHDQLPSVEQARLFVATMMNESEKQGSGRNLYDLPLGGYRDDEQSPLTSFRHGKANPGPSPACNRFLTLAALFLLWALVIFDVVLIGKGNGRRMETLVTLMSNGGMSDLDLMTTQGTPQHMAANWLANLDPLQVELPAPGTPLDPNQHFGLIQRYSLAVLFFALGGDTKWTNPLKFTSGLHECSWFNPVTDETGEVYAVGVTCDNTLRVTNLLIPGNKAEGTIPDELANLSDLDFLSLKHNNIGGSLPESLSKLTKLDYLDLNFNQLGGTVPEFVGSALTDLQVLGLGNNDFQGSLPTSLALLQKLRTLSIGSNNLEGGLLPVASMVNLRYLYAEDNLFDSHLDRNALGHESKALLDDLTELIEVDLSMNNLKSSELPSNLFTMPFLTALDLSHNRIMGTLPADMNTNLALEFLSLRGNFVSGAMTSNLTNLEALVHLDLEDNDLSGVIPPTLFKGLTSLNNLFLGKNPFNAWSMPGSMADMMAIKELSLDNANLIGSIPSFVGLEAWKSLKVLDLHNNSLTGTLPEQWSNAQELSVLLLNDNKLTGLIPQELSGLAELTVVALHHNEFIADVGDLCRAENDPDAPASLDMLTTDCDSVTCACCEVCCAGDDCYSDVDWGELGSTKKATREEHFTRASYSFNPHIVSTSE